MFDAASQIGMEIPSVAGKSLLRIKELSAAAKYSDRDVSELDMFISLFCSYVQKKQKQAFANDIYDLQLAALGTIGDIMPLVNENRIIVRGGLKTIAPAASPADAPPVQPGPGISELLDKLELSGSRFDVKEIAWKVCPVINAARRMGNPEKAAALFFEEDPAIREKLAGELVAMNRRRKLIEDEIWNTAELDGNKSLDSFDSKFSLVCGEGINKGVTGLIAQRLAKRFNVPGIAVSFGQNIYTGSIRSARGFNVCGLLEQFGDIFIDSGGHAFAGGFSFEKEKWDAFNERLKMAAYSVEFSEEEGQLIRIDAELPAEYLGPEILDLTDSFAPYGNGNEALNFLAKNLVVEDINFVGKTESKHLKMILASKSQKGPGYKWPALFWDAAERVLNKEFGKGDHVDVVCNFTRDWFRGIPTPQMMIIDLKKS
jgi:single-stranded-DNA-specific exonuclease